jgi:ribonuclease VapC
MVVDTSVVLAVFFDEPHGAWAATQLGQHAATLRMSTVNLAESLIRIRDRQPTLADDLESRLLTSGIRFVAPDTAQARTAAWARTRFPLNLGDCFAYALAVAEECSILAIDRDFRVVDRPVVRPPD